MSTLMLTVWLELMLALGGEADPLSELWAYFFLTFWRLRELFRYLKF